MAYVSVFMGTPEEVGADCRPQTTAHFGAFVFGSDIDGRQMRGKGEHAVVLEACNELDMGSQSNHRELFAPLRNTGWRTVSWTSAHLM